MLEGCQASWQKQSSLLKRVGNWQTGPKLPRCCSGQRLPWTGLWRKVLSESMQHLTSQLTCPGQLQKTECNAYSRRESSSQMWKPLRSQK